jgi:hypothetical protein
MPATTISRDDLRGGKSIAIVGIFMAVLQEGVSIFPERALSSRVQRFPRIFTVMTIVITVKIKHNAQ